METWQWILIAVIGLVANWCIIAHEVKRSPEGAMGMGGFLLMGLVPWLVAVLYIVAMILNPDDM